MLSSENMLFCICLLPPSNQPLFYLHQSTHRISADSPLKRCYTECNAYHFCIYRSSPPFLKDAILLVYFCVYPSSRLFLSNTTLPLSNHRPYISIYTLLKDTIHIIILIRFHIYLSFPYFLLNTTLPLSNHIPYIVIKIDIHAS